MTTEIFEIFDDQNHLLGKAPRAEVHARGLFHRSVHILLFNGRGELLMQRRAEDKDICPTCWDLSAAEHLKPGETTLEGALRGLQEELGINQQNAPALDLWRPYRLETYCSEELGVIDNEFVETYLGKFDGELVMDTVELSALEYWSLARVEKAIADFSETFTPWFLNEMDYYFRQKKTAR